MARPALHSVDAMLDAARTLLLEQGLEQTTIQAIAETCGAPVGSLYNRFGSRRELLTRLWLRAAERSQRACLEGEEQSEALAHALAVARRFLVFTREQPADARLLASFRRHDLLGPSTPELEQRLADLNRPVGSLLKKLGRGLFGNTRAETLRRVRLAIFDVPLAAVRGYLLSARNTPMDLDAHVLRAARAVLTDID